MSNDFEGFEEVVNKTLPLYDPCLKKVENAPSVAKTPTDDSYIMGYYLGFKEITKKDNTTSIIHSFQLKKVGNTDDLSEECSEGDEVSMWGRTTLNDDLQKNVPIGTMCLVKWKGKQANKAGTRSFHVFDVLVKANDTISSKPTATPVGASATVEEEEEDDLPF